MYAYIHHVRDEQTASRGGTSDILQLCKNPDLRVRIKYKNTLLRLDQSNSDSEILINVKRITICHWEACVLL